MKGNLVWKLLRQHISIPQLAGFFFANLVGMSIVLLGYQFYRDVVPLLTEEDGLLKTDFVVVSKKVGTFDGRSLAFSPSEQAELAEQGFVKTIGAFTAAEFKVDASMRIDGRQIFNSELPIESVPDDFIDVPKTDWTFDEGREVPIILPRSYIAMYNFGFAHNRALPKVSEGVVSMIAFDLLLHGNGRQAQYKGRVIGFSSRLNAILVPESFMTMANRQFAPDAKPAPTRLIVQTGDLAEDNITQFLEERGYDAEDDKLNSEKATFLLRLIISIVMVVGLIISLLSLYILMLSIYLLVQKNAEKLQNLLLIGYRPSQVARPYQLLTIALNGVVLVLSLVVVAVVRGYYMRIVDSLFPTVRHSTIWPAIGLGLLLFIVVTAVNLQVIKKKIKFL
ncbi:MAG: ABC transporter permease [Prevotella sp.]|nr:ABC transporter permease [Prevotella sp.]